MKIISLAICAALSLGIGFADPPTAPEHPEKDFKPIGGGLFVSYTDPLNERDSDGNRVVAVYSRHGIAAGGTYSLDAQGLLEMGVSTDFTVDGGTLGELHRQTVTMDCAQMTYEVVDTKYLLPRRIWQSAKALPALEPLFRLICVPQSSSTVGKPVAKATVVSPISSPPMRSDQTETALPANPAAVARCTQYLRSLHIAGQTDATIAAACAKETE